MTVGLTTFLLVDADEVDVMAVRRAFRDLKIANPLVEAQNGIEALDRLRGEGGYHKVASPVLLLLDLNMPRMGGHELLAELRGDALLRHTLVFVMTTSAADDDRRRAYDQSVAGHIVKQHAGSALLDAMRMLQLYARVIRFPD